MDGMNASTGKRLGGLEHMRQSVADILRTPLGTRVMRRDYGSELPRLIDAPINRETITKIIAAGVTAINKWEPRFRVKKINVVTASPGSVELDVTGDYLPEGSVVTLDGIVIKKS
jgi:uncharacterized protein